MRKVIIRLVAAASILAGTGAVAGTFYHAAQPPATFYHADGQAPATFYHA
jgi:hypothetical protein